MRRVEHYVLIVESADVLIVESAADMLELLVFSLVLEDWRCSFSMGPPGLEWFDGLLMIWALSHMIPSHLRCTCLVLMRGCPLTHHGVYGVYPPGLFLAMPCKL